jgi:hypothetical protein
MATTKANSTDVVIPNRYSDEELTNITNIGDVNKLFAQYGVSADTIANYGTGFTVVKKDTLINKKLVILEWHFYPSDKGPGDMVTVHAFTNEGDKVIFNDGSSGVREQLRRVMNTRMKNGVDEATACRALYVNGGLKSRTYDWTDPDTGEISKATTFDLSES